MTPSFQAIPCVDTLTLPCSLPQASPRAAHGTHMFCRELIDLPKHLLLALGVGGQQVGGKGQRARGGLIASNQEQESLACYLILCQHLLSLSRGSLVLCGSSSWAEHPWALGCQSRASGIQHPLQEIPAPLQNTAGQGAWAKGHSSMGMGAESCFLWTVDTRLPQNGPQPLSEWGGSYKPAGNAVGKSLSLLCSQWDEPELPPAPNRCVIILHRGLLMASSTQSCFSSWSLLGIRGLTPTPSPKAPCAHNSCSRSCSICLGAPSSFVHMGQCTELTIETQGCICNASCTSSGWQGWNLISVNWGNFWWESTVTNTCTKIALF